MPLTQHHALLYCGRVLSDTPLDLGELARKTEIEILNVAVLSIAMVRDLTATAYVRPFEKDTKTIVLEVGQIAGEAQHALLKLLEEPPATTKFILVLPSFVGLLPTLRSRLHQPTDERSIIIVENKRFTSFLQSPLAVRINEIASLAKAKETTGFDELASGLADWLTTAPAAPMRTQLHAWLLILPKRGSSKKMLWEDIALRLPLP